MRASPQTSRCIPLGLSPEKTKHEDGTQGKPCCRKT